MRLRQCLIINVNNSILNKSTMSNEKQIRVLENKIARLGEKIANFEKNNIDEKKTNDLKMKKLRYETQLEEIQYA